MTFANYLPQLRSNPLEMKADNILLQNNIYQPHEIDLYYIIKQYPWIRILYSDYKSKAIMSKKAALLVLNETLSEKEHRQELAEEFSHALLHCGNQLTDQQDFFLSKQESQARRLSAYLLCPLYMLKNMKVTGDSYYDIPELAQIFHVTEEFMKYRLSLIWGQDMKMTAYVKGQSYGYMGVD